MYSTVTEVRDMIKPDALNQIIGDVYIEDEAEREAKIVPLIEAAILDADGEIDGYLSKRYKLPLGSVPKVINKFSKDLAVYNLFSRIGQASDDRETNYQNRYKAAIKFFENVAKGLVDIGIGSNEQAPKSDFKIKSNTRLFSRDSLKGM